MVTLNSALINKPVVLGFRIVLEFTNVVFCGERETGISSKKENTQSKDENQQQTKRNYLLSLWE